ncbi:hypothetical protein [Vibrio sp. MA40-2]|uniref:hypothetical protein n=1 Tax=Vibrio sp. MA40-2 TaxID=3391828 RepID=UPI0039A68341
MINVLVPLSGGNTFKVSAENNYPKILTDVDGQLLIERAAKPFLSANQNYKITIALPQPEADKYQLPNVLRLLGNRVNSCSINGNTQGAICSALLAIEELDLDSPLIVTSFEQVFDIDINRHIETFIDESVDAGVLTFDSKHPKWSYVKTDENDFVTQAAEKMPISNRAIAGLYYFKSGRLFVESAKNMIRKDVKTNNSFYISPTLNEVILKEGKVKAIDIDKNCYFHVNNDHELSNYEQKVSDEISKKKEQVLNKTEGYAKAFDSMDIEEVITYFSKTSILSDPVGRFIGKSEIYEYVKGFFDVSKSLKFNVKSILVTNSLHSIIEFELYIDGASFVGTDVIEWNSEIQIQELRAYLYETKENG